MNFVSWFEIPAFDIHRAAAFYTAIYGFQMELSQNGDHTMALFPAETGVGGAIVAGPGSTPSAVGVLVYLNATMGLDVALARVEASGGRVVMPRSFISDEAGSFALIIDTEGNRIALHEPAVTGAAPIAPPADLPVNSTSVATTEQTVSSTKSKSKSGKRNTPKRH